MNGMAIGTVDATISSETIAQEIDMTAWIRSAD